MSVIQIPAGKNVQMEARLIYNPIAKAKRLGANLATLGKAKTAKERRIQTNPACKKHCTHEQNDLNRKKTNLKCKQVENKSNFSATLEINKKLFSNS